MQGIECWTLPSTNSDRSFKEGWWILTDATRKTHLNRGFWHIPATLLCWQENCGEIQRSRDSMTLIGLSKIPRFWFVIFLISYGFSYHFYPLLMFHHSIITHLAIVFDLLQLVSFLEHHERRSILSRRLLLALLLPCLPRDPSHWNNPGEKT